MLEVYAHTIVPAARPDSSLPMGCDLLAFREMFPGFPTQEGLVDGVQPEVRPTLHFLERVSQMLY